MMDLPHEQATSDPDRTLELRDNLADFLKIVFAEADAGILETVPAARTRPLPKAFWTRSTN